MNKTVSPLRKLQVCGLPFPHSEYLSHAAFMASKMNALCV